jgi:hypothetical protein
MGTLGDFEARGQRHGRAKGGLCVFLCPLPPSLPNPLIHLLYFTLYTLEMSVSGFRMGWVFLICHETVKCTS